jgi:hypothetical protein
MQITASRNFCFRFAGARCAGGKFLAGFPAVDSNAAEKKQSET